MDLKSGSRAKSHRPPGKSEQFFRNFAANGETTSMRIWILSSCFSLLKKIKQVVFLIFLLEFGKPSIMALNNQKRKFREKSEFVKSNYPREEKQRGRHFLENTFLMQNCPAAKRAMKLVKYLFRYFFVFPEMFTKSYGSLTNQAR